jgi:hypothetical protein
MPCPNCGKSGSINIAGRNYCSNCGTNLDAAKSQVTDLRPAAAAASAAPLSVPTPAQPTLNSTTPAVTANPSGAFHGRGVSSRPAVLDLRQAPAPTTAPAPNPAPTIPQPASMAGITAASKPVATAPAPTTVSVAATGDINMAAPAAQVSTALTPPPVRDTAPSLDLVSNTQRLTQAAAVPKSPAVQKFNTSAPAAPVRQAPTMPAGLTAQIEEAKKMLPEPDPVPALPAAPSSPDLEQALAAARPSTAGTALKVGSAVAAIILMGGVIWTQNAPKLAFHSAAAQAGIDATMPTYIPSSYRQAGPVAVGPGQISLNFVTPGSDQPLQITQRRSSWDSDTLRENYISKQSDNFLTVPGQGLTIYLYNGQASWINHGVWYNMLGTAGLSQDQILKIAYGL